MIELKPCPFCGTEAEIVFENGAYTVRCWETIDCGVEIPGFLDKEEATEIWNRRVEK